MSMLRFRRAQPARITMHFANVTARKEMVSATVLAVVVGLLAIPVQAQTVARHLSHTSTNPVHLALALAERYWRERPCQGAVTVTASEQLPAAVTGPNISRQLQQGAVLLLAWTSFETPAGPNAIELSPSTYTDCKITLNAELWRNWRIDDGEFHWLCDLMTHEVGHLFGHPDEGQTDRRSIEYPVLEPGSPNFDAVPQCGHVVLWYGRERFVG
jgi:hypothetical protein